MKLHEVVDNRPLIWQLAAQLMEKGKTIVFHGRMPNSSSYLVGKIEKIGMSGATVWNFTDRRFRPIVVFTPDDDDNLTLRRANDPTLSDYLIVDKQ